MKTGDKLCNAIRADIKPVKIAVSPVDDDATALGMKKKTTMSPLAWLSDFISRATFERVFQRFHFKEKIIQSVKSSFRRASSRRAG
jgi:hypothetical protein